MSGSLVHECGCWESESEESGERVAYQCASHRTGWMPGGCRVSEFSAAAKVRSVVGIGGAPSRATTFPEDADGRKQHPVASGVLDYFPDALVAIAQVSWAGNEQHNPGQPLHWARGKSADEADAMIRHFLQRGSLDSDGMRHTAKMAWRALALLQKEIEAERKK